MSVLSRRGPVSWLGCIVLRSVWFPMLDEVAQVRVLDTVSVFLIISIAIIRGSNDINNVKWTN